MIPQLYKNIDSRYVSKGPTFDLMVCCSLRKMDEASFYIFTVVKKNSQYSTFLSLSVVHDDCKFFICAFVDV